MHRWTLFPGMETALRLMKEALQNKNAQHKVQKLKDLNLDKWNYIYNLDINSR